MSIPLPPVSVGSISSIVRPRVGFHFELDSTVKLNAPPLCADLKVRYHLPPDLFVDPYELDLRSARYSYKIHPVVDLEVPVHTAGHSYSTLELVVHTPLLDQGTRQHSVVLPLHARYGHPSLVLNPDESYEIIRVLQPIASWPCEIAGLIFDLSSRCFLLTFNPARILKGPA